MSAAQGLIQVFFVPVPEEEVLNANLALNPGLGDTQVRTIIGITATRFPTILYYDQGENGYEPILTSPTDIYSDPGNLGGTQIWGDDDCDNGYRPDLGLPANCTTGNGDDVIGGGDVIILDNVVNVPLGAGEYPFNGGDKIGVTFPVAITRSAWGQTTGTVLAGATEVFPTRDWGTKFRVPGGENLQFTLGTGCNPGASDADTVLWCMFEDARIEVVSGSDGTLVGIDLDGDDVTDFVRALDEGENLVVDGVNAGTSVSSNAPLQVTMIAGDVGSNYEQRWFALVPTSDWDETYLAPVGTTTAGDEAEVVLFNPHASDLTVNITTNGAAPPPVVVPAGSAAKYVMPTGSGARFDSSGCGFAPTLEFPEGCEFFALASIDRESTTHDWGHTVLPESTLSRDLKVGWAPGSRVPATQNSSPIWITSSAPTDDCDTGIDICVCVDFDDDGTPDPVDTDGDGIADFTPPAVVPLGNLDSVRLFNSDTAPIDFQTGARVFSTRDTTCSPTSAKNGPLLAGAWGQDPATATGGDPALDVGTTVLQVPPILVAKEARIEVDQNGNGLLDPGDILRYDFRVVNTGTGSAVEVTAEDTLDPATFYLEGTTVLSCPGCVPAVPNGTPVADDAAGTPFPLDEGGLDIGDLGAGQSADFTFLALLDPTLVPSNQSIINEVTVSTQGDDKSSDSAAVPTPAQPLAIDKSSSATGELLPGDTVTYTIQVSNPSDAIHTGIEVLDTPPSGTSYVNPSTSATGPIQTDVIRVTEYYIPDGSFSATTYDLTLNQNLAADYFVIIQGSDGDGTAANDRGPDENYARLTQDPFGTGDLAASTGANVVRLERNAAVNSWVGVVTVVESLADQAGSGFRLRDVQSVLAPNGSSTGTDISGYDWTGNIGQIMLLGGYNGAGCQTPEASTNKHPVCQLRIYPSAGTTINWTRNTAEGNDNDATSTVMVLEWGTDWTVQRVQVTGTAGGDGANLASHYDTAALTSSVTRANTWVWGTGFTDARTAGESAEGVLLTLGDGDPLNELDTESSVAAGSEYTSPKDFEVYALTHPRLATDYYFKGDGDALSLTHDVTVALAPAGDRMALAYNGLGDTADEYPRPMFSARYFDDGTVRLERRRFGTISPIVGGFPAWMQMINWKSVQVGTVTVKDNTGGPNPLANGVPPNLVLAADGYGLAPGETLTITYQLQIDTPLDPDVTIFPNTASVTSNEQTDPVTDSNVEAASASATIGDRIWLDADGDGVQDVGEPGIVNVEVSLVSVGIDGLPETGDDVVVDTTISGENGGYLFTGVGPGTYYVDVDRNRIADPTLPTGLVPSPGNGDPPATSPPPTYRVTGKEKHLKADFGYTTASGVGVIGDYVWSDANNDGKQDAGEAGIGGVLMELLNAKTGALITTTTTAADGSYLFTGLAKGKYKVRVAASNQNPGEPLEGYTLTQGKQSSRNPTKKINIKKGKVYLRADFGYFKATFSIDDRVWFDANSDGTQQAGERGLEGVVVDLVVDTSGDGIWDPDGADNIFGTADDEPIIAGTMTDANGDFSFDGLEADNYLVVISDTSEKLSGLSGTTTPAQNRQQPVTVGPDATGVNFGFTTPAGLSGVVWSDANGDGVQDANEPGIPGVTIELQDGVCTPGTDCPTTVSGPGGTYDFTGLPPGTYTVVVTDLGPDGVAASGDETLTGYTQTGDPDQTSPPACTICDGAGTATVTLTSGDNSVDFGYQNGALADISGNVFEDFDVDGVDDGAGEPGFETVTLELVPVYDVIAGLVDVDGDGDTDADDDGFFEGVVVIDGGLDINGDGFVDASDDGYVAGFQVIDGVLDIDGDGTAGESGDDDVTFAGEPLATATTDSAGDYSFPDVAPGRYRVQVTDAVAILNGYTLTSGLDAIDITVAAADITGIDFGYIGETQVASIGDRVFYDLDRDGAQDAGEGGIAGVTLDLYDAGPDGAIGGGDDVLVASAVSGADGSYVFPSLAPGSYYVDVTDTAGVLTGLGLSAGSDPSAVIQLAEGEVNVDADFGYSSPPASGSLVGDTIFYDADADGFQDPGEVGIAGVTVNLWDPGPDMFFGGGDDVLLGTAVTDAAGQYLFSGVSAGKTYVEVDTSTLPAGYNTTPTNGPSSRPYDVLVGEDILFADFGFNGGTPGSIGDTVYRDIDGNGTQDAGEPGIEGVTLSLRPVYAVIDGLIDVDGDGDVDGDDDGSVRGIQVIDGGLDVNGDGTIDAADDGTYEGVTVINGGLDLVAPFGVADTDDDGTIAGPDIATAVTDASGVYTFLGVPAGEYVVEVTDVGGILGGLNNTESPAGSYTILGDGSPGDTVTTADFGYAPSAGTGTIGGTVWHDTNQTAQNGVLDAGESGMQQVTVELWLDVDGDGVLTPGVDNLVRTATTDENGEYEFLGVPFGDYLVTVSDVNDVLAGFQSVAGPTPGADGNGQVDPYAVTLEAGTESDFTADFAYEAAGTPHSISGTTFFDASDNGVFDQPAESGVGGVTVYLYRDLNGDGIIDLDDALIGVTISDANGDYTFEDLPDGDFLVAVDTTGTFLDDLRQTTQQGPPATFPDEGVQPVTISGADIVDQDFGFTVQATAVLVSSFGAELGSGGVVVRWETASEAGAMGFFLYRWDEASGDYSLVNAQLLPAAVGSPQGGVYELVDETARAGDRLRYALVEIEMGGAERTYGPFEVEASGRSALQDDRRVRGRSRPELVSETLRKGLAAAPKAKANRPSGSRPGRQRASQLDLEVTGSGLYRVTAAEIGNVIGLSSVKILSAMDSGKVRLSTGGESVAWRRVGDGLVFYGEAIDSAYTAENVYRLELGTGETMTAGWGGLPPAGATTVSPASEDFEQNLFAMTVAASADADLYYWAYLSAGDPTWGSFDTSFQVMDPELGEATLEVRFQSTTSTPATDEHQVRASLNGTDLGTAIWDGTASHAGVFTVPSGVVFSGSNTLELTAELATGVPYSVVLVDGFSLTYPRLHRVAGDRLLVDADAWGSVSIEGLSTADVLVADVTDAKQPLWLDGVTVTAEGATYRASFAAEAGRAYAVSTTAALAVPGIVGRAPSQLRQSAGAEYLVIAPETLASGAQALADYRTAMGLSTMVVDLDEIYGEFSDGVPTPEAIHDFLSFAWSEWPVAPRFAVLAGDGTFDYQDHQGVGDNLVPPLLVATPQGMFASDVMLGDVSGGDGVPEIAVGRIPATTDSDLAAYVAKLSAYEGAGLGAGVERLTMLADNADPAGDFASDGDFLLTRVPEAVVSDRIYLSEMALGTARSATFAAFAAGTDWVNYLGHGGIDRFANEGLLLAADAPGLAVGDRLPVVSSLTCSVGRFEVPGWQSLAEALVLEPDGGAAVVWAPAGQSYHFEALALNEALFGAIFSGSAATVGELVLETLSNHQSTPGFEYLPAVYNLIGDPAYRVR